MGIIVLATAIWMAVDSSQLGYDKRDVRGLAAMSPVGWFFAGILLWIVAFPLYLVKRGELKAAGERRRLALATGQPMLPGYYPPPGPFSSYPPGAPFPPRYPHPGHPHPGHAHSGHPHPGHPHPGHAHPGHAHSGHPHPGHPQAGAGPAAYGPGGPYPPTGYGGPAMPPSPGAPPASTWPGERDDASEQDPELSAEELAARILKLQELRDAGLLTEAEYQQQKARVLSRV